MSEIVKLDSRKRVPLAKVAESDYYLVEKSPSGVITLTPAVIMTKSELEVLGYE